MRSFAFVLSGLIVLLLGVAFLVEPDRSAEPQPLSTSPALPHLTIDGPGAVVHRTEITFAASSDDGDVADVLWSSSTGATALGPTFTFPADTVGEIWVGAELADDFGRARRAEATVTVEPDPLDADDDGDGLDNRTELSLGTDPGDPDTDDDGLTDADEVALGTDPARSDTDEDGLPDEYELAFHLDALGPDDQVDTDGDGFDNRVEFEEGTNPQNALFHPGGPEPTAVMPRAGVNVDDGGVRVTFEQVATARTDRVVEAGSGIWYAEITTVGSEVEAGLADGSVPGEQSATVELLAPFLVPANSTVGLIVDARTSDIGYWVLAEGPVIDEVGPRIDVGTLRSVALAVAGDAGAVAIVNAGDDPVRAPLRYGPHYTLYNAGIADAEFMARGWGPVNAYAGPEQPRQYDEVRMTVTRNTGKGVTVSANGLAVAYDSGNHDKQVVLANQGMIGEFRYWEATRLYPRPVNVGQGILSTYAELDPYPGADGVDWAESVDDSAVVITQPGVSLNSLRGIWEYPDGVGNYESPETTSTYGFAVDYRGSRPVVHVIVNDTVAYSTELDIFTPVHPAMYGTPLRQGYMHEANFGARPFVYDAAAIMAEAGIDTSGFRPGWGPHTGQVDTVADEVEGG